jgi:hypothetical protein
VIVARSISDDALITINSLELLGIIYLAIAVSMLRERIAKVEGLLQGKREQKQDDAT